MKRCSKCNIISDDFYKDKNSKDGFRSSCKKCDSLIKKKYAEENSEKISALNKKKYLNNIEKVKEYNKDYNLKNKEKISESKKEYYINNKEKISESKKDYYINNKEIIKIKKNNHFKYKLESDIIFRLKYKIKNTILLSLKNKGFGKNKRTYEILGCSFEEFKLYLESKFEDWMTWENRGLYNGELNYGWDIDHIIPLSIAKTEEDVIKLNHYSNLQPLCSKVNRDIKKDNL